MTFLTEAASVLLPLQEVMVTGMYHLDSRGAGRRWLPPTLPNCKNSLSWKHFIIIICSITVWTSHMSPSAPLRSLRLGSYQHSLNHSLSDKTAHIDIFQQSIFLGGYLSDKSDFLLSSIYIQYSKNEQISPLQMKPSLISHLSMPKNISCQHLKSLKQHFRSHRALKSAFILKTRGPNTSIKIKWHFSISMNKIHNLTAG